MIAIITLNYNLHKETIECVNSVLNSDYQDILIYLIDNGSEISDYNELKEAFVNVGKVKILSIEKNRGYVGGINFGLETVVKDNPRYIMIMNNDTILDKSAITALVKTAEKYKSKAIVSGKVYDFYEPDVIQQAGLIFYDHKYLKGRYPGIGEKDTGQLDEEAERDSLDDVFWLLPAQIINDIGYYCNYFFLYAEQGDYAQRARRKGYKLIYTPNAKIWHKGSMTSGNGDKQAPKVLYWRGKAMFIFQYRNLRRKYFIIFIVKNFMKYSLKYLLAGREQKKNKAALLAGYFAGFKWLFNKQPDNGYNPYLKN